MLDVRERMAELNRMLTKELEVLELGSKIQSQVQSEVGKNQREYFLREQMKAIQKELGEGDDQAKEIDELREKIDAAGMPDEVKKEALRELDRLSKMPSAAAEYTVARTYIDWLVALPWSKRTEEVIDLLEDQAGARRGSLRPRARQGPHPRVPRGAQAEARRQGPDPLLRRASGRRQDVAREVDRARRSAASSCACRSAACATRRKSAVIAARTSARCPDRSSRACAAPSRKNPVFILDEIDKLGNDFRGDPASALLEVLDPEQNNSFRDHYLDVPFDLSEVLFITTANVLDTIPGAAARPHGSARAAGLHRGREARRSRATTWSRRQIDEPRAVERRASRSRTTRCEPSFAATRARPASATSSARSAPSAARSRAGAPKATRRRSLVTRALVDDLLGAPRHLDEEMKDRTRDPGVADRPGLDAGRRRRAVRRSVTDGRRQPAHAHRPARRRDEGVGAHRAVVVPRQRARGSASIRSSTRTRRSTCTCRPARFRRTGRRPASRWSSALASALSGPPGARRIWR